MAPAADLRLPMPSGAQVSAWTRSAPSPRRGVVVLHEILGVQPEMIDVLDRFAEAGYAAILPDLFGLGRRAACVAKVLAASRGVRGEPNVLLEAAREWLMHTHGLPVGSIGLIGFCLGGGFALATGEGWGAVSANYGFVPPDDLLAKGPPVFGCFGGRDRIAPREGEKLRDALERLGHPGEVRIYPEAGHSFLTPRDRPIHERVTGRLLQVGYHAESAADAWPRILDFFEGHLTA